MVNNKTILVNPDLLKNPIHGTDGTAFLTFLAAYTNNYLYGIAQDYALTSPGLRTCVRFDFTKVTNFSPLFFFEVILATNFNFTAPQVCKFICSGDISQSPPIGSITLLNQSGTDVVNNQVDLVMKTNNFVEFQVNQTTGAGSANTYPVVALVFWPQGLYTSASGPVPTRVVSPQIGWISPASLVGTTQVIMNLDNAGTPYIFATRQTGGALNGFT